MTRFQAFELLSELSRAAIALVESKNLTSDEYHTLDTRYLTLRNQAVEAIAGPAKPKEHVA